MARQLEKVRNDSHFPAEPAEVFKILFQSALTMGRNNDNITLYLPPAREHAENIVDRTKPVFATTFIDTDREV